MKLKLCIALLTAATLFAPLSSVAEKAQDPASAKRTAVEAYGRLPLSFEPTESPARFLARSGSYAVLVGAGQSAVAVTGAKSGKQQMLRFAFENANPAAGLQAMEPQPGVTNYYLGSDPAKWRLGVKSYARLRSAGVYPGVDVVYYGDHRRLEFDFVVAPKADPGVIALSFSGMDKFYKEAGGDLVAEVAGHPVRFAKPYAYQKVDGASRPVDANYELSAGGKVHLRLGDYDRNRELIVDPTVTYATFLGGSRNDMGNGIAVDNSGDAYVTGETCSIDFPLSTQETGTFYPACDAFVTEYNAAGTAYLYTTILGGPNLSGGLGTASGNAIALDSLNQAYIVGTTNIEDLPDTASFPSPYSYLGGDNKAFIYILSATGTIVNATYLGGTGQDYGWGIAVDYAVPANVIVVGQTCSQDFPFYNAFETMVEQCVAFVTKLDNNLDIGSRLLAPGANGYIDPSTSSLVPAPASVPGPGGPTYYFSEPYGGQPVSPLTTDGTWAAGTNYPAGAIVEDTNASPGVQLALNSGTSGIYCPNCTPNPIPDWTDKTLGATTLDQSITGGVNTSITWRYLGPYTNTIVQEYSEAYGVAIDPHNDVIFTGGTDTATLTNGFWPCHPGTGAGVTTGAWVLKVAGPIPLKGRAGGCLYERSLEATQTGSTEQIDTGRAVAVDVNGNAYVVGTATGTLGIYGNSYQPANASTIAGGSNAFLFSVNGSAAPNYSTYLGGSGSDQGLGVAVDLNSNVYVTGSTRSSDFPVINSLTDPNDGLALTLNGKQASFITKFATGGSSLLFSSYLGGSDSGDQGNAIAVNNTPSSPLQGNMYVTGTTYDTDFESNLIPCLAGDLPSCEGEPYVPPQTLFGGGVDDQNSDAFVAMFASSNLPTVTIKPYSLAFGNQEVGLQSAPQAVQYTNNSSVSSVSIDPYPGGIVFSDPEYTQVTHGGDCLDGGPVAPLASCNIWVVFTPTSTIGSHPAILTISDSTGSGVGHTVQLSGYGVQEPVVGLSTGSLTFPSQLVHVPSTPLPVTLTNNGPGILEFSSITFTGIGSSDFSLGSSTCGSTLAVNASCTINVIFTPAVTGPSPSASLVFTDNASNSPQSVTLSGTGTSPSGTIGTIPAVNFGNQLVGTPSTPQTVVLTNTAASVLTVTSIKLTTNTGTDFAISSSSTCSTTTTFTLALNATCKIVLIFTPSALGPASATLTITGSAPNSPYTVALTGTGTTPPDFTLTPANSGGESVTHGMTATFTVSVIPQNGYNGKVTFTCTGTGPACLLSTTSVTLDGKNAASVRATMNTRGVVNKSATYTYTFTGTTPGTVANGHKPETQSKTLTLVVNAQ
jgi:hypothetical protein